MLGAWWLHEGLVDVCGHGFKKNAPTTCSVTDWSSPPASNRVGASPGFQLTEGLCQRKWPHLSDPGSLSLHHGTKAQSVVGCWESLWRHGRLPGSWGCWAVTFQEWILATILRKLREDTLAHHSHSGSSSLIHTPFTRTHPYGSWNPVTHTLRRKPTHIP